MQSQEQLFALFIREAKLLEEIQTLELGFQRVYL